MPKVVRESEVAGTPNSENDHRWYLLCPGCYEQAKRDRPTVDAFWIYAALHVFNDTAHQFNGDTEKPTLSPSLLVTGGGNRCHSYVRDGMIRFLGDCTHPLAGQTVELMDAQLWLDLERQPKGDD